MISVDALYGIIEDGLNSKMGQVAIADKYGVGQTTVNRIFKLHDIHLLVPVAAHLSPRLQCLLVSTMES
jgi:hypothetical protein